MAEPSQINKPIEIFPAAIYQETILPDGALHEELIAPPVIVPNEAEFFSMGVQRILVPDTTELVMKCRAELSLDGGLTWSPRPKGEQVWPWGAFPIGFTAMGGELPASMGSASGVTNFPFPPGIGRKVRITFVPLKTITASVSILFSSLNVVPNGPIA